MSSTSAEQTGPRRWPWPARLAFGVLVVAALTLLVAARRPAGITDPTIWAEDGSVFMAVAWQGPAEIAAPYAGQLWLLQRTLAYLIGFAPPQSWPVLLYLTSSCGIALVAATPLLHRGRELFGPLPYRFGLALGVALLPATFEAQGNITNVHWWALGGLLLLTAMPAPATHVGKVAELALIVALGLTGATAVFALPVALWRVFAGPRTSRYLWARVVALALASAVILANVAASGRGSSASTSPGDLPAYLYLKWGSALALGEARMAAGEVGVGDALALVGGLVIVLVLAVAVADLRGPSPLWLVAGLAVAVLGAFAGGRVSEAEGLLEPRNIGRYLVVLLLASVFVLVRGLAVGRHRWTRIVAGAGLVIVVVGVAGDAKLPPAGPAVDAMQLANLRPCFDGEPPFTDAVACTVDVVPESWQLVVFRPGYESLRAELREQLSPPAP